MCEPLQGKSFHPKDQFGVEIDYIRHFNYHDIKSAVNFYKKYYNGVEKFQKDFPQLSKEVFQDYGDPDALYNIHQFNRWLLNYTFKDAIE